MPTLAAHPASGSGNGEQARLDKNLRRNAEWLRAKSGADGDFAAAACGVLAEQRGNIDADQQHQQAGGAEQDRQHFADHTEKSALEMRRVVDVQIPAVE